ncbi:MAG: bifunctional demethylmenaquinone methyltransferase/2-methoxy-6-polyprenyl-1,4-benzoquinol methylase UbiE [Kiloniellaceae bacterium]
MTARHPSHAAGASDPPDGPPPAPGDDDAGRTHFGYREVGEAEKPSLVRGVFRSVAGRYDLMNDLMSGGIHRLWKSAMVDWLNPRRGLTLLDTAGGTGDIAFRVLDRLEAQGHGGEARVIVCDLTAEMLAVGRDRAVDRGLLQGLSWVCGDAERLPLPDRSVTAYTIAFGLRNVTHIERALAEARRVLKPGGRFLCLEFSRVVVPLFADLYDQYSFRVLPAMGAAVAGDRESYLYLAESIRRFPPQEDLAAMLAAAGLSQVRYRNLSGGIAALHSGWRI